MKYLTVPQLIDLLKTNSWEREQEISRQTFIQGNLIDSELNEKINNNQHHKNTFKTYNSGFAEVLFKTEYEECDIKLIYEEEYEYFNDDKKTFRHEPSHYPLLLFSQGVQIVDSSGQRCDDLSCQYPDSEEYIYLDDILKANKLFKIDYSEILSQLI